MRKFISQVMLDLKLQHRQRLLGSSLSHLGPNQFYDPHNRTMDKWAPRNDRLPKTEIWSGIKVTDVHVRDATYLGRGSGGYGAAERWNRTIILSFEHKDGWGLKAHFQEDWGGISFKGAFSYDVKQDELHE